MALEGTQPPMVGAGAEQLETEAVERGEPPSVGPARMVADRACHKTWSRRRPSVRKWVRAWKHMQPANANVIIHRRSVL